MQKVYQVRDVTTIRELCESSCDLYRDNIAFLWRSKETVTQKTYGEVGADVVALATYLCSLGLSGKTVAVMGQNSYAWALTYLAVCSGVGVILPIDRDLNAEQLSYVLHDSEASAILYQDALAERVESTGTDCQKLPFSGLSAYLEQGRELLKAGDRSYATHEINPLAFGILLYTSGTMGVAKGVMLSQYNICSNVRQASGMIRVHPEDRALSVLPLHHTYECTAGFLTFFFNGASIAYSGSLRTLMADFQAFRPTVLVTVPLMMETFYKNIMKKYRQLKGGKFIFAVQRALSGHASKLLQKKVFATINTVFGGNLRAFLCGAAPLPAEIFNAFRSFGFTVYVGYGLTETSPVCMMHTDDHQSPDDVGFRMPGTRVRIDDPDENGIGELVVKGTNVMLGYYHNPAATAEVMENGWFHTGDLARENPDGTFSITGRIKSMIVAANGKKIFPEELEEHLRRSPYVKECMVFSPAERETGSITASIYPDEEALEPVLCPHSPEETPETLRKKIFDELIASVNRAFPSYKQISHYYLRREPFVMTTTKKIKRNDPENQKITEDNHETLSH